jgi:hypothetical protein
MLFYCHPRCENRVENYPHSEAQELCVTCGGLAGVCCPDCGFECNSGLAEEGGPCSFCGGAGVVDCPEGCLAEV